MFLRGFIQRDVYAKYCGYTVKMEGYTKYCGYMELSEITGFYHSGSS